MFFSGLAREDVGGVGGSAKDCLVSRVSGEVFLALRVGRLRNFLEYASLLA